MVEISTEEAESYNKISTKMVITWKKRQERGGWFRRARLVARQFKSSIEFADYMTYAPTASSVIARLFLHIVLNVFEDWEMRVMDVKDAFLMSPQPAGEKNAVLYKNKYYALTRSLPGQRTAAKSWYDMFRETVMKFGGTVDEMQPTLFKMKDVMLSVHVDDVIMAGTSEACERLICRFKQEAGWKLEVEGPFKYASHEFTYLKRKYQFVEEGVIARPDPLHIEFPVKNWSSCIGTAAKTTPCRSDIVEIDKGELLPDHEITAYRSAVGKLLYIAGERPDCQFAIHNLAKMMSRPTTTSLIHLSHLIGYLKGTSEYGLKIRKSQKGKSILDMRDIEMVEPRDEHLLEIVTDADYAGCKKTRKSVSYQIYLDSSLIESRVRGQKSVALSSGESEFVALVAASSEAMFIRHLVKFLLGSFPTTKARSDSSAARAMCHRQGVGRVRHIDSSMFWIQDRVQAKVIEVTAIPTAVNSSDIGTKSLSRARTKALMFIIGMVTGYNNPVGEGEYNEIQVNMHQKKNINRIAGMIKGDMRVAAILALSLVQGVTSAELDKKENDFGLFEFLAVSFYFTAWALGMAMGILLSYAWFKHMRKSEPNRAERLQQEIDTLREENDGMREECSTLKKANEKIFEQLYESDQQQDYLREVADAKQEIIRVQQAEIENEKYGRELEVNRLREQLSGNPRRGIQREDLMRLRVSTVHKGEVFHISPRCQWYSASSARRVCITCAQLNEGSMIESTQENH